MSESRSLEKQAIFERMWLLNSQQFNPSRNSRERERIVRVEALLQNFREGQVIDIGAGFGAISLFLAEFGAKVLATDIAENALKHIPESINIQKKRIALPEIDEPDNKFDLVLCLEVLGEIDPRDHRLSIAELARIVKQEGVVMLSTTIDIHSEDAISRLQALMETEFKIEAWHFSYHSLQIKLLNGFKVPERYFRSWKYPEEKQKELKKRKGFARLWYTVNSTLPLQILWGLLALLFKPIVYLLEQNRALLLALERITKLFMQERGVSHVLLVAKQRPLIEAKMEPPLPDRAPFRRERKWE